MRWKILNSKISQINKNRPHNSRILDKRIMTAPNGFVGGSSFARNAVEVFRLFQRLPTRNADLFVESLPPTTYHRPIIK
jgi:hypothetical protein